MVDTNEVRAEEPKPPNDLLIKVMFPDNIGMKIKVV
jgi:hypothetical protein